MYKFIFNCLTVLLLAQGCSNNAIAAVAKPNIIVFYVDDLGWQDSQLNDVGKPTPWETPNMLALAKRGMNFSQAYSPAPTCAPSRAGLLSGQAPAKINLTHVLGGNVPKTLNTRSRLVAPYIYGYLKPKLLTLAEALQQNGYKTGHVGKWHLGDGPKGAPSAQGFDFSYGDRGVHRNSQDRSKDFDNETYPLSKAKYPPYSKKHPQGIAYPLDNVTEQALSFIDDNKSEPFFLYLAHWMVHSPIVTRNRALLEYYTDKLGMPFPKTPESLRNPGQTNPYYGAMVTTVDWSLGRVMSLLETTDDPRNPGKKLIDTTYVFMSSDNGGAENAGGDVVTDNFPLDKGKKYTQEGGIRVPMVIAGPTVVEGKTQQEVVSQLDFYPTILSLTQSKISQQDSASLSGLDISKVLSGDSETVFEASGESRQNLFWHFPHNQDSTMRSALRQGDFKLYLNHLDKSYTLYRLYKDGKPEDLEEQHDLAALPQYSQLLAELGQNLAAHIKENNAEMPYLNPEYKNKLAGKEEVPQVASSQRTGQQAELTLVAGKTKIKQAYLLAEIALPSGTKRNTPNLKTMFDKFPVKISADGLKITAQLPADQLQGYLFVLIDENNFLVKTEKYAT